MNQSIAFLQSAFNITSRILKRVNHAIHAYCEGEERRCISNWEDDHERGAGRVIMNALETNYVSSKLICVTLWSSPEHIGRKPRFKLIKEATETEVNPQ